MALFRADVLSISFVSFLKSPVRADVSRFNFKTVWLLAFDSSVFFPP